MASWNNVENRFEEKLKSVDDQLWSIAKELKKVAIEELEKVTNNFPEYTLHDFSHCENVFSILSWLIPTDTQDHLSKYDLILLLASVYLHDLGMACPRDYLNTAFDEEYGIFKSKHADELDDDSLFREFLRQNHHTVGAKLFLEKYVHLVASNQLAYKIAVLIESHGKNLDQCKLQSKFFFETGGALANVLYIGACLRIADYLDVTEGRAPLHLFASIRNPVSVMEWRKHLSIAGVGPSGSRVSVSGKCDSYPVHIALNRLVSSIDEELDKVQDHLSNQPGTLSKQYRIDVYRIKSEIEPNGYELAELRIALRSDQIIRILGREIYANEEIFIRELLQNSIDACRQRAAVAKFRKEHYIPRIYIRLENPNFQIVDNGIGMDKNVLENFLCRPGESWYRSNEYRERYRPECRIKSIARFGIGFLSCLSVASEIVIKTSMHEDHGIIAKIHSEEEYIPEYKRSDLPIGTTIELTMKDANQFLDYDVSELKEILMNMCPLPAIDIHIEVNGERDIIKSNACLREMKRWAEISNVSKEQSASINKRDLQVTLIALNKLDYPLSVQLRNDGEQEVITSNGFLVANPNPVQVLPFAYRLAANFKSENALDFTASRLSIESTDRNEALFGDLSRTAERLFVKILKQDMKSAGESCLTGKILYKYLTDLPSHVNNSFYKMVFRDFCFTAWLSGTRYLRSFREIASDGRKIGLVPTTYINKAKDLSLQVKDIYFIDSTQLSEHGTFRSQIIGKFCDLSKSSFEEIQEYHYCLILPSPQLPRSDDNPSMDTIIPCDLQNLAPYAVYNGYDGRVNIPRSAEHMYSRVPFIDISMSNTLTKDILESIFYQFRRYFTGIITLEEVDHKIDFQVRRGVISTEFAANLADKLLKIAEKSPY